MKDNKVLEILENELNERKAQRDYWESLGQRSSYDTERIQAFERAIQIINVYMFDQETESTQ